MSQRQGFSSSGTDCPSAPVPSKKPWEEFSALGFVGVSDPHQSVGNSSLSHFPCVFLATAQWPPCTRGWRLCRGLWQEWIGIVPSAGSWEDLGTGRCRWIMWELGPWVRCPQDPEILNKHNPGKLNVTGNEHLHPRKPRVFQETSREAPAGWRRWFCPSALLLWDLPGAPLGSPEYRCGAAGVSAGDAAKLMSGLEPLSKTQHKQYSVWQ